MEYNIANLDTRLKNFLENTEVFGDVLFSTDSAKMFNVMTGVKAPTALVMLNAELELQDGTNCGFNADGTTEFSNRILEPAFIKLNGEYCPKTFLNTWRNHDVKMAATQNDMPFEQEIVNQVINKLSLNLEKLIWSGNKNSGDLMNGIITLAKADSNVKTLNVESDSIWERCKEIYLNIPETQVEKPTIFLSLSNYRKLLVELMEANMYHINEKESGTTYELYLPNTDIKVKAVVNFPSTTILATPESNLFLGIDGQGDTETFDIWYSKDSQTFKLNLEFAYGVQYAYGEKIIIVE